MAARTPPADDGRPSGGPSANDPAAKDPAANDPAANDPAANDPAANDRSGGDALSRALEGAVARFADTARRLAHQTGLGADDLDELLQEVRLRLWRSLGTSERIRDARALYVRRTVLSAALDLIRRRRARREQSLEADTGTVREPAAPDRADRELERTEFDAIVARAIAELGESRRVVVRLHLAGYGREEIARMLGWTEPKTRNLLYRGLAELRESLERVGVTPRMAR